MKHIVISALIATVALPTAAAFAQMGEGAVGTWLTEDGRAKIRTEHCGESGHELCAYVVWLKSPLTDEGQPRTDIKNPDPAKRSRPSLGLELMSHLKVEDDHYAGEIYNAEDGKMYAVTVSSEKPETLKVHGCMLRILCGSQTWERVADVALPGGTKMVAAAPLKPAKPAPALGGKHDQQPTAK